MNAESDYRQLMKNALLELESLQQKLSESERSRHEPIAVIGMGCRFPGGADSPEAFGQMLRDGVDAVAEVPKTRWNLDDHYHPDEDHPGGVYSPYAALLAQREVEGFDPQFFGIAPREAAAMDPQHCQVLEVCWESLEHAGLAPDKLAGTATGLFLGCSSDDYLQLLMRPDDLQRIGSYDILGTARSVAAGRVAHLLDLEGPAVHLDTACSSSLTAVHWACQSLRAGECNLALAGAVNLQLSPILTIGLCRLKALSRSGRCRTFDADADGFVRGEGCGIVVLKRLSDAQREGDRILAVIAGGAVNHDGHSAGLTVPNQRAQEKLIRLALRNARIAPADINYIEAHGTGTPLGDPIEIGALRAVFHADRSADQPLFVGSVKTNIGHLEAAAGMAGLMKVILAVSHGEIYPNLHFHRPNPAIDWDETLRIPTRRIPWPDGQRRIAGVSAFGFSGTNAHLLVEAAPTVADIRPETARRPLHVLPLSAKSEWALGELANRYRTHLADTQQRLEDICFTSAAGRAHFSHRLAIVAASPHQAERHLQELIDGLPSDDIVRAVAPQRAAQVAFLCTGQGSQYVGMGSELYRTQPTFRKTLDRCDEILRPHLGQSLIDLIHSESEDPTRLGQTRYAQPALFAVEYSLARLWQFWGIQPAALMGHGVGQYVAACLAGVFSLEHGLELVAKRGQLMQDLPAAGAMVAVVHDSEQVAELITPWANDVAIAAVNGPRQVVISGRWRAVEQLTAEFDRRGIPTTRPRISHALHSPLVEPMLARFGEHLARITFRSPQRTLICNFSGAVVGDEICRPEYWQRQLRQPVRFADGVRALVRDCDVALEIGPHPTLTAPSQHCLGDNGPLWVASLHRDASDWSQMLRSLSAMYVRGVDVDWTSFDQEYRRDKVALPTYPFQRQRCWWAVRHTAARHSDESSTSRPGALLAKRLKTAGRAVIFECSFDTLATTFADHQFKGTAILPLAALLEMAHAAAREVKAVEYFEARKLRSSGSRSRQTSGATMPNDPNSGESGYAGESGNSGESGCEEEPPQILQLVIERALTLDANLPRDVQLVLTPTDQDWGFELFSRSRDSSADQDWMRHATGRISPAAGAAPDADLVSSQQRCQQTLSVDETYASLEQVGLEYGPQFRLLQRLSRGEDHAVGMAQLPDEMLPALSSYELHPMLLDAAMQVISAVLPSDHRRAFLPVRLARMRVFAPVCTPIWSHAQLTNRSTDHHDVTADVRLFSSAGDLIAELQGLVLQGVSSEQLLPSSDSDRSDWIYQIAWEPRPLETSQATDGRGEGSPVAGFARIRSEVADCGPKSGDFGYQTPRLSDSECAPALPTDGAGTWVLLADRSGAADKLAHLLRAEGQHCVLVLPGDAYAPDDGTEVFRIRPEVAADCDLLLDDLLDAGLPPAGVVHLWSLDGPSPDDQRKTCGATLHLVQALARRELAPRLMLVTRGGQAVEDSSCVDASQSPLWGMGKVISIEQPNLQCQCIDLEAVSDADNSAARVLAEIKYADFMPQVAWRGERRYVARLARQPSDPPVPSPAVPFRLQLREYGALDGFTTANLDVRSPGPHEVIIEVVAAGLNFRDVLRGLGLLREFELESRNSPASELMFGFECAGMVTETGDAVTRFKPGDEVLAVASGCFASQVCVDSQRVVHKPHELPFVDAASIPVAFMTAAHALRVAHLQAGQRILVHAAAGGVGMAAIQLAQDVGAEVIGTASPAKWPLLRARGVRHVMNSRTSDFAEQVLQLTEGRGVDAVLNSLSGEFIPEGLRSLAEGGSFIEIGKIGIWAPEQVAAVRPDVRYLSFDLGEEDSRHPGFMRRLLEELMPRFSSGSLSPLPHRVFPVQQASRAFHHMAQARHVGKVVLSIKNTAPESPADTVKRDGTYLITGGLGGLGSLVAKWLVDQGARYLTLVGRSGAADAEQLELVQRLETAGANVLVVAADVSQQTDVERVLREIKAAMPPLRGIVHAAGILEDATLLHQDWQRFERVMAPKIRGAWLLDQLTRDCELDWFVMFSSLASMLGAAGQSNYAAANAYLDALAHQRRAEGLPALSISWGPWQATGMAASLNRRQRERLAESGLAALDEQSALATLQELLQQDACHVGVVSADWSKFCDQVGRLPLWSQLDKSSRTSTQSPFLVQLKAAPESDRLRLLTAHLRMQVAQILGLDNPLTVPTDRGFHELGMDSLTSVELSNRLQSLLDCHLPATLTTDYPTVKSLASYLDSKLADSPGGKESQDAERREPVPRFAGPQPGEPIAILGLSCRMPGGCDSAQAYWRLVSSGAEAICEVPPDRWDVDAFYDSNPDVPGKMSTRFGGFLSQVDQFDPRFFGIMPREAHVLDPQQRLLLEAAYEALEDASIPSESLVGMPAGVFVGIAGWDFALLRANDFAELNAYSGTGSSHSTAAGRISYTFGCTGPAIAMDTACSSALVALHVACQSLRQGECELAISGGVNAILAPDMFIGFSKARMLSPDGRCRTFDESANGYVRGEGVGCLVLKRLSDAQRDGDRILAVIRGSAVNQDGRSSGLTVPNGPTQAEVIRRALDDAGVTPDEISYLEAHGTATPLGDPIELAAIGDVFAGRHQPLLVGSVKTNIGHLETASGIAGLIKVVLALQHEQIPPHLHFQTPNSNIHWQNLPIEIPTQTRPWPAGGGRRLAGVSAFGFSGTNAHIILAEAPAVATDGDLAEGPERPMHVIPLSVRTESAMPAMAARYTAAVSSQPSASIADMAHAAATGRSHWEYRQAVIASTAEEAKARLTACQHGQPADGLFYGSGVGFEPDLAMLFTGQGSQYPEMGRLLFETQPTFRQALERCDAGLRSYLPSSLISLLFASAKDSRLDQTAFTQPALFALEYALFELWKSWGIDPTVMAGHSIGEYVAACVSGVFRLDDALKLVAARGQLMQSLPSGGGMVAVMAEESRVRQALDGRERDVSIAAVNGPRQVVISGRLATLEQIVAEFTDQGVITKQLDVSHAFHSPLMEPALDEFCTIASQIDFAPPQRPYVSNARGEVAGEEVATPEYWRDHIRLPVQFAKTAVTLEQRGCNAFLEVGPHPTLLRACQQSIDTEGRLWLPSLQRGVSDWETLLGSLASLYVHGADVDWKGFDRDYRRRHVTVPFYPFQRQRYWPPPAREDRLAKVHAGQRAHPLLGPRLDVAGEQLGFENEIAAQSPAYLADHCVFGVPLFPAAAYLEVALAAAAQLPGDGDPILSNVSLARVLPLTPGVRVVLQLLLEPRPDGHAFRLFSRDASAHAADPDTRWREHAWGDVSRDAAAQRCVDLESIRQRCWLELEVGEFYEQFHSVGLEYGPAFRGIRRLWRADGEALGQLQLPPEASNDQESYRLHPALLDAALQVVAAASPEFTDETYLPVGVERLCAPSRIGPSPVFSHARLRETTDESLVEADIALLDEQGNVLAELVGLRLKLASSAALSSDGSTDPDSWLMQLAWRKRDISRTTELPQAGTWLVLADDAIGPRLVERLRQQGEHGVVARPGTTFARQSDDCYELNPASLSDFRQLLNEVGDRQPPLKGIVHLWGVRREAGWQTNPGDDFDPLDRLRESCGSVLHLVQSLEPGAGAPLWLISRGAQSIAGHEPVDPFQTSLWGLGRVIAQERPDLRCRCVDLDPASDEPLESLLDELLATDDEDQVSYRHGERYVARLAREAQQSGKLTIPTHPYRLKLLDYGNLDEFQMAPIGRRRPGRGEVEVQVRAAGLNFRDVLRALGMLQSFEIPLGINAAPDAPFGFECAGRVVAVGEGVKRLQVGDNVLAVGMGTLRSHLVLDARQVVRQPDNLSAAEAGSIPLAFLTAFVALDKLADLKQGERVLIHAAAGGVGQAAVQLARQRGAEIFATASSAKWDFLHQQGIPHVMNSRDTDFADEVLRLTDGQGVDVVLNSLTGDFIPASLKALADGGRFVEIGKIDIWSQDQMREAREDASYFRFDLGDMESADQGLLGRLLEELMPQFAAGEIAPLPIETYGVEEVADAFRQIAQARHRGKVVVMFDQDQAVKQPTVGIHSDVSYVITGGLGALGLQVARHLVKQGARRLVLTGRHGADTPARQAAVAELTAAGAAVQTVAADVSRHDGVERIVQAARALGPLRGVVHAAGVLRDGLLQQQNWEQFEEVLRPKVGGAWHLHRLTQSDDLDFFVCFSSVTSLIGSPGQSNYATANAFVDGLAHARRALDQPAVSINWGPWAESGMAARLDQRELDRMKEAGWTLIEPQRGLELMMRILDHGSAQVGVIPVDWQQFIAITGEPPALLSEVAATTSAVESSKFLKEYQAAPASEHRALLMQFVRDQLAAVLACESGEMIEPRARLFDLGLDSLATVELQSRLQRSFGFALPRTLAFDYPTVEAMVEYFHERLESLMETTDLDDLAADSPTELEPHLNVHHDLPDQLEEVEAKLKELSDSEVEELLQARLDQLDD